jgi:hypothetical protein
MARFGTVLVGVLAFLSFIPASYAAEERADEVPLFAPTSGWLVGPASLVPPEKGKKTRVCIMANQFDNGMGFRFSGTGKAIKALAIDFRQAAFKKGEVRDVNFRIGDDFDETMEGVAYDAGTLVFSVGDRDSEMLEALQTGKTLTLDVANHTLEFALLGAREGLQRLSDCHKGGNSAESMERQAMMEEEESMGMDSPMSDVEESYALAPMRRIDVSPVNKQELKSVSSSPMQSKKQKTAQKSELSEKTEKPQIVRRDSALPEASKKADRSDTQSRINKMKETDDGQGASVLDAMLSKAEKALNPDPGGLGLKEARIEPASGGHAAQESSVPEVVQKNIPLGVPRTDAMKTSSARDVVVPKPVSPQSPRIATPSTPDRRWRVMKGASLREVLDVWATNSNARLVWKSSQDFNVKRSATSQGSFESAVDGLLQQYNGDGNRPTAKLYNDPSGQKVLVVGVDSLE